MLANFASTEAAWPTLRVALAECQYSTAEVLRLLGGSGSAGDILADTARWALRHSQDSALRTTACGLLARLFLFSCEVETRELALLPSPLLMFLRESGLIEYAQNDSTMTRGTVSIIEYQNHYFLSDPLFSNLAGGFTVHTDPRRCMPLHASSLELLRALSRPPGARSFLDIGCGTGCQSILFSADYESVAGFDSEHRAVMFARVNAALNSFDAQYQVGRWESAPSTAASDHIAFNTPDQETAFSFISKRAEELISRHGMAQLWVKCEITKEDRDLTGLISRMGPPKTLEVTAAVNRTSPFSLSAKDIREQTLPKNTLLVRTAAERRSYLNRLADQNIIEVVSAVLTINHK